MNHKHHGHSDSKLKEGNILQLATSATLHCLVGCGIGEVAGLIIATHFGLPMTTSMILAITLGFIAGFALGIIPLIRKRFAFSRALKIVLVAEGLSIAVMEAFEALTQLIIPGVMTANLTDSIFWVGMFVSLTVGFLAALPINYFMIKKGIRHQH